MEYLERSSLLTGKVEMIEIVRIVNSVFESNTYLAISRNYGLCFLIDCGDPIPIIENILIPILIIYMAWTPSLMNIRKLPSISLLLERKDCTPIN